MKKIILLLAMGVAFSAQTIFAQVPSNVPTSGLLAYYPFNGNANDESGNGHNGTVNEAILSADRNGNANSSYSFDGDNDYITTNFLPHSTNQSRTISLWFNANDATMPTDGYCLASYGATAADCSQAGGRFELGMFYNTDISANSIRIDGVCTGNFATSTYGNGWHHFVATYDNSLGNLFSFSKIYFDGVLVTVGNYNPNTIINTLNLTNLTIGQSPSSPTNRWYKGLVDEVGVWNRALTQQEITNMYNSVEVPTYSDTCNNVSGSLTQGLVGYWPFCGNANDDSGNGNNGTVNGATLTTDRFGNSNSAYSFDGNDDVVIPNSTSIETISNSFSISVWSKIDSFNNFGLFPIIDKNNLCPSSSGSTPLFVNGSNSTNGYHYQSINCGTQNMIGIEGESSILNQWVNTVVSYDGISLKIYRNGVLKSSNPYNISVVINSSNLTIGHALFGVPHFAYGLIDDIGIWNRALSQQEITNLYNANQCITNITVTDTLIINVGQLSYNNPATYANNITMAPNPASTQININFNNITNLNGGTLKVINSLGQEVATTPITTSGTNSTMQLATWGSTGMYFVQIINPQGQIVDIKKIILQ